jgi:hypothetical protein
LPKLLIANDLTFLTFFVVKPEIRNGFLVKSATLFSMLKVATASLSLMEKGRRVSQALYGWDVKILEKRGDQVLIQTAHEQGLVDPSCLKEGKIQNPFVVIGDLWANIYPIADVEEPAILSLPLGAKVELVSSREFWHQVKLIDGQTGYLHTSCSCSVDPEMFLEKAVGTEYLWGGVTLGRGAGIGIDCSGLLLRYADLKTGVKLPHSMHKIAHHPLLTSVDQPEEGDFLFFWQSGRATHGGIYLGQNRCIQAGGSRWSARVSIEKVEKRHYDGLTFARLSRAPAAQAPFS